MEAVLAGDLLRVDLGSEHRCLASTVLGGGLGTIRTWVNLQVPSGYARTDPDAHLAELTAGLPGPVVGMLTAAAVERFQDVRTGSARAFATVGLGHPMAAAGIRDPLPWTRPGTINIFVVTEAPLTDAGLAGALQTAVEAKVQALTEAGIGARNIRGRIHGKSESHSAQIHECLHQIGGTVASGCPSSHHHFGAIANYKNGHSANSKDESVLSSDT